MATAFLAGAGLAASVADIVAGRLEGVGGESGLVLALSTQRAVVRLTGVDGGGYMLGTTGRGPGTPRGGLPPQASAVGPADPALTNEATLRQEAQHGSPGPDLSNFGVGAGVAVSSSPPPVLPPGCRLGVCSSLAPAVLDFAIPTPHSLRPPQEPWAASQSPCSKLGLAWGSTGAAGIFPSPLSSPPPHPACRCAQTPAANERRATVRPPVTPADSVPLETAPHTLSSCNLPAELLASRRPNLLHLTHPVMLPSVRTVSTCAATHQRAPSASALCSPAGVVHSLPCANVHAPV